MHINFAKSRDIEKPPPKQTKTALLKIVGSSLGPRPSDLLQETRDGPTWCLVVT